MPADGPRVPEDVQLDPLAVELAAAERHVDELRARRDAKIRAEPWWTSHAVIALDWGLTRERVAQIRRQHTSVR